MKIIRHHKASKIAVCIAYKLKQTKENLEGKKALTKREKALYRHLRDVFDVVF